MTNTEKMPEEVHLARIDSVEFGKIIVDGKTYNDDIVITASGKVTERPGFAQERYGTHHIICVDEMKSILQENPRVIVIGTGQYGACRLERGVEDEAKKQNAKLIIERTPKAIHLFNNVNDRKAGLFHLTC